MNAVRRVSGLPSESLLDRPGYSRCNQCGEGPHIRIDACAIQCAQVLRTIFDPHHGPWIPSRGQQNIHQKAGSAAIVIVCRGRDLCLFQARSATNRGDLRGGHTPKAPASMSWPDFALFHWIRMTPNQPHSESCQRSPVPGMASARARAYSSTGIPHTGGNSNGLS
jgi:hypothetical protein